MTTKSDPTTPATPATPTTPATPVAPTTRQAGPPPDGDTGFVRHAVVVAGFTLASRLTGLVRDAVLAALLGLSTVADAFFLGFLVPNLFRRLFGEGALAAAFIPHYSDVHRQDAERARRFASLALALLTLVLVTITLLGEASLAAMLAWGDWDATTALALRLMMLMLPYMPLVCVAALLAAVLQVRGRFGPPAAAPVILNLFMITAAAAAALAAADAERIAHAVALGVLVAGVVQVVWLVLAARAHLARHRPLADLWPPLRSTLVLMLPMIAGLAVFQLNALLDSLIAFGFSPRTTGAARFTLGPWSLPYPIEPGSVGALQWAQRLYQFPLGVFGIAVATAIFPALASAAKGEPDAGAGDDFLAILQRGLRLTVFIGLPASAGLMLLALPAVRVIYERGAFHADDSARVAAILVGYAASVWAYSMMHLLARAYHARKDARAPLYASLAAVGFNLLLNLVLIWPLGAAGLAWSTALSAVIHLLILLAIIGRHVDGGVRTLLAPAVWRSWARTAALTAGMALTLVLGLAVVDPATLGPAGVALLLALAVAGGAALFFAAARLTGAEELTWLLNRERR
ncbi:MAG: murein biosynthesis integral membrane protein MurJ [Phycisphaeraceae bacterium]